MSELPVFERESDVIIKQQAETIKQLEQQLREKEARIGRLESAAYMHEKEYSECGISKATRTMVEIGIRLRETPQQSLAHIQAEAVYGYASACAESLDGLLPEEYANQLRQQADKG